MADTQTAAAPASASEQVLEKGLLDQIVEEGRFGVEPASKERGKNLIKEFVAQVLDGSMTIARDAEMMINARIAQIDHLVSLQLNEVMHNAAFQKLFFGGWDGKKARNRYTFPFPQFIAVGELVSSGCRPGLGWRKKRRLSNGVRPGLFQGYRSPPINGSQQPKSC